MRPGVTVTSMNAWKPLLIGAAFAALTAAPALATPILAHTTYVWTIHGDVLGTGHVTTGNPDAGGFDIVAFDGIINGVTITGLLGGQPGGQATSPAGAFYYDNILYNGAQSFDIDGVLFTIAGGQEGNIWGTGPGSYSYYTGTAAGSYDTQVNSTASFDVSEVPEPASLSLFGFGVLGAGILLRRNRRGVLKAA